MFKKVIVVQLFMRFKNVLNRKYYYTLTRFRHSAVTYSISPLCNTISPVLHSAVEKFSPSLCNRLSTLHQSSVH
jgi:hypothetical protein